MYKLEKYEGESSSSWDIELKPLGENHRDKIPKSEKMIAVNSVEETNFGKLICKMDGVYAIVGLYKDDKKVGRELMYEPSADELKNGIPEWRFDLENKIGQGSSWGEPVESTLIWTIHSLRTKGSYEMEIN